MPSVHLSQQGVLGHVQILATQNNCKGEGKSHGRSCWWLHRQCCARSWDGRRWQKFATLESGGDGKESTLPCAIQPAPLLARRSLQACAPVTKLLSCYYNILLHITTLLLSHWYIITSKLLRHYYNITTNCYPSITTYYILITSLLLHNYFTITSLLLHSTLLHIITVLLRHYFIITSSLLHLSVVLLHITFCPLSYFITTSLLPITTKCHYFKIGITINYHHYYHYYVLLSGTTCRW